MAGAWCAAGDVCSFERLHKHLCAGLCCQAPKCVHAHKRARSPLGFRDYRGTKRECGACTTGAGGAPTYCDGSYLSVSLRVFLLDHAHSPDLEAQGSTAALCLCATQVSHQSMHSLR